MWAQGQSPAEYIYGTITTITGDQFEGFIRWGKEEIYWHDLFNSDKICNDKNRIKAATKSESRWSNFTWDYSSIWQNKYNNSMRSFATEFGGIKTLHIKGHEGIDLELKNGAIIKIKGGSNDVGATLRLDDYELGTLKFKWDRIERVDFMQAPTSATVPYGEPIYGILETRRKDKFEGYIKWD